MVGLDDGVATGRGRQILGTILNSFVLGGDFAAANITAALPALALFAVALWVGNRWVQIVTPLLLVILFGVYFAQYFSSFEA